MARKPALKLADKTSLDRDQLINMYREMLFYRRFEERVLVAYTKQKFSGFCHVHIGQEAVCVGIQHALRDTDHMISGYRSHTQAIAKGISPEAVMAELFGKVDGCARGKGGSMHMFSREHRFYGGHGIVGGQVPIAAGIAFAIKYRKEDDIVICYLGDAAVNQGQFFEAMNMAATWDLPVLFVIENNQYGMGTSIKRTTSIEHLYERALGFNMAHSDVNGMNVVTMYEHTKPIVEQMRQDKKPYLLEVLCYRYKGHSVSDPGTYRTKEELEEYQKKDPILTLARTLTDAGFASEDDLKSWDRDAKERCRAAEQFADNAPLPDVSEAYMHVYPDPIK